MSPDEIKIGYVTSTYGLSGAVKVCLFCKLDIFAEKFASTYVGCKKDDCKVNQILNINNKKNLATIKVGGVDSINEAELLKGCDLLISRHELPDLHDDELYTHDIIGMTVKLHGEQNDIYGTITHIRDFGAGTILEIKRDTLSANGKPKIEMMPFTKEIFPEIDVDNRIIYIDPPEIIDSED